MYSILSDTFYDAQIIKVPDTLRLSSLNHKWGIDPFHFHDAYYKEFLRILASIVDIQLIYKVNATLQNK